MESSWEFASSGTEYHDKLAEELDVGQNSDLLQLLKVVRDEQGGPQLAPVAKDLLFEEGFVMIVKATQLLRRMRNRPLIIGIGGPSGSGKTSLANKVADFLNCPVMQMDNYIDPLRAKEEKYDDFSCLLIDELINNLKDICAGRETKLPVFDTAKKARAGFRTLAPASCNVVVLEGTYALRPQVRPFLDIAVAVAGGVHQNLVKRVQQDIHRAGSEISLQDIRETLFPNFKHHIEPDLAHAQIRIENSFGYLASLKDPIYCLKSTKSVSREDIVALMDPNRMQVRSEQYTDVYLKPSRSEGNDRREWMRHRQCGVQCFILENTADQRTVIGNFIVKPRVEFEVGPKTLGGLLQLGYQVGVSFKRWSDVYEDGEFIVCVDTLPEVDKIFVQIKGSDRQIVLAAAARLGIDDSSLITTSYREVYLSEKGEAVSRIPSPPLSAAALAALEAITPPNTSPRGGSSSIHAPTPVRRTSLDLQASQLLPGVDNWELTAERIARSLEASTSRGQERMYLKKREEEVSYDHGLYLAMHAASILGQANGPPIMIGIGGPSGSGKTSLSKKLANILGSEVLSMENYLDGRRVKDGNYDELLTYDVATLKQNLLDLRASKPTRVPSFSFLRKERVGYQDFKMPDSGVVILEGIYALHCSIEHLLDVRIAVTGGVQTHLVQRVSDELERNSRHLNPSQVTAALFPMYFEIQSYLTNAHLKIHNTFKPVQSLLDPLYVLKSKKPVQLDALKALLRPDKMSTSVQTFSDFFFYLPGTITGKITETDWIRVRESGGRYTILIREPIKEGNFTMQPRVDFDISSKTVAGLHALGYHIYSVLEVRATIIQDDKLTFELDELQKVRGTYLQIKSTCKKAVQAAGDALELGGTYTTESFLQIMAKENPVLLSETVRSPSAAALEQLVHRVGSQHGSEAGEDTLESLRAEVKILKEKLESMEKRQFYANISFSAAFVAFFVWYYRVSTLRV